MLHMITWFGTCSAATLLLIGGKWNYNIKILGGGMPCIFSSGAHSLSLSLSLSLLLSLSDAQPIQPVIHLIELELPPSASPFLRTPALSGIPPCCPPGATDEVSLALGSIDKGCLSFTCPGLCTWPGRRRFRLELPSRKIAGSVNVG